MMCSASCSSFGVGRRAEAGGAPAWLLALGVSAGGWRLRRAAIGPVQVPSAARTAVNEWPAPSAGRGDLSHLLGGKRFLPRCATFPPWSAICPDIPPKGTKHMGRLRRE